MSEGAYDLVNDQFLANLGEKSRINQEAQPTAVLPAAAAAPSAHSVKSIRQLLEQQPGLPTVTAASRYSPPQKSNQSAVTPQLDVKGQQQQQQQQAQQKQVPRQSGESLEAVKGDPLAPKANPLPDILFERDASCRSSSLFLPVHPMSSGVMMSGDEFKQFSARMTSNGSMNTSREPNNAALGALERRLSSSSMFSVRDSQMAFGRDTILGPKRPRPHKIWRKKYIKVLVVGDSGLGKTTLIKSLMSTPGDRMHVSQRLVHDGTFTPTEQFKKDPSSLCSTISWRDEEDRVCWVYKIQDTPGYGDDLNVQNNIDMMLNYIKVQNDKWLELEQSRDRKEDLGEVEDTRVDVCIFCLPPHRMRPIDLKYMYELGLHVPIVPVVTKADTMTIREASVYRNEVASKIANPMLAGIRDKINIFKFERDTLERAGVLDHGVPTPPFLVIASNEINEDLNQAEPPTFWPERRYPWGTAEAFNREHSDLLSLRALLLKEALEEINKTKRQRYEGWRRAELNKSKLGRHVRHMLMWTIVPAILCLQVGKKGLKVDDVKQGARKQWGRIRQFINKRRGKAVAAIAAVTEAVAEAVEPPADPPAAKKKGKGGLF